MADRPPVWTGPSASASQHTFWTSRFAIFQTKLTLMHAMQLFEQNGTIEPSSKGTMTLLIVQLFILLIRLFIIHYSPYCSKYALEVIVEMIIFCCIHDVLCVHWISMKGNLYWLAIIWIICETLYLYGYSKVVPSRSSCMDTHEY
jgi:hypothetical protein